MTFDVPTLHIRTFEEADAMRLHDVFHTSIHTHAVADHSREQLAAWSPPIDDAALATRWVERMRRIRPFVVEVDGRSGREIAAYADVQPDGYIDHFFVAGNQGGRGVGSRLMTHLVDIATGRGLHALVADVSVTAQRFFARFGFVIVERRTVVLRGVEFTSARMRLGLEAGVPDRSIDGPTGAPG